MIALFRATLSLQSEKLKKENSTAADIDRAVFLLWEEVPSQELLLRIICSRSSGNIYRTLDKKRKLQSWFSGHSYSARRYGGGFS